jgi:hypothetical protein
MRINAMEPDGKHNIVAVELEQVKKLEGEIAVTDSDILQKRLEQGRLLASLKNNVQGIETWQAWTAKNLDFSRKTADNYIALSRWYVAHFDDGRADKEAHLAEIKETGGKSRYRHDGYTSFNAVYELLSIRSRKMKAASKPAKDDRTKAKAAKPPKITQKQKLVLLENDNTKLIQVVKSFDPKHPVLAEINVSLLPDSPPARDVVPQKRSGSSSAKKPAKGKKPPTDGQVGDNQPTPDQVADDRLAAA